MLHRFIFPILFLLCAATQISAEEPSPSPKRFSAYIGGFFGPSYRVEWSGGELAYTASRPGQPDPKPTIIQPTAAQWLEFRQALDELKVWQWQALYTTKGVLDGSQWSLDIAYADHALSVKGNNGYPDARGEPNGKPEPTKTFNRYLEAISKLLGGRNFR